MWLLFFTGTPICIIHPLSKIPVLKPAQCVHHSMVVPVCPPLCGSPSVSTTMWRSQCVTTMWRSQCVHHYEEVPVCPPLCGGPSSPLCGGSSVSTTTWRSQCVHHYVEVPHYMEVPVYLYIAVELMCMCCLLIIMFIWRKCVLSFENYINVVCGM